MNDRVDDHSLVENNVNGPGEANEEGGKRHGSEALDERLRSSGNSQSTYESGDNSHDKEQRRHLVEVPAQAK